MMLGLLQLLLLVTLLLGAGYGLLILSYSWGWLRVGRHASQRDKTLPSTTVAVVVAFRNEREYLPALINCLRSQNFPPEACTFVLVDDQSTDDSGSMIKAVAAKDDRFHLLTLDAASVGGKKKAIDLAIRSVKADLILCTDADCTMGPDWVHGMVSAWEGDKNKMLIGPVSLVPGKGSFAAMQVLEFLAIMGSTAGAVYWKQPIMANGANLAYGRETFLEMNGFRELDQVASGDDVLWMYKFSAAPGKKLEFVMDPAVIVHTPCKESFHEFWSQRKRWASKPMTLLNGPARKVSYLVFLFSLFLILSGTISGILAVKSTLYLPFLMICLILFGIKCFIDFLLLFLAGAFFGQLRFLWWFLPQALLYPMYVVVVGFASKKRNQVWKGRLIN